MRTQSHDRQISTKIETSPFSIHYDILNDQTHTFSHATHNTICGAICVYLLIGLAFSLMYLTVLIIDPDGISFEHMTKAALPNQREKLSQLMYFSFCTLTTLGYGDIIPVAHYARTLAWLEAVTGQLYLAILVARLVGLNILTNQQLAGAEQNETMN